LRLFFFVTAEFETKDLVQDLNRLLQFAPGSQPNAAILREFRNCDSLFTGKKLLNQSEHYMD